MLQHIVTSYFVQTKRYIYIYIESLIWFLIALITLATHLGANYYIEDLFIDTSVYDEYYQDVNVDYKNSKDTNNLITIYIE